MARYTAALSSVDLGAKNPSNPFDALILKDGNPFVSLRAADVENGKTWPVTVQTVVDALNAKEPQA